jgi:hypothetical protein
MKTYWLSFTDDRRPAGDQFQGVAIVEVTEAEAAVALEVMQARFPRAEEGAEWIAAAIRRAWMTGCNPGGQVQSVEIPPEEGTDLPRHQLLSRETLKALGAIEDEPLERAALNR